MQTNHTKSSPITCSNTVTFLFILTHIQNNRLFRFDLALALYHTVCHSLWCEYNYIHFSITLHSCTNQMPYANTDQVCWSGSACKYIVGGAAFTVMETISSMFQIAKMWSETKKQDLFCLVPTVIMIHWIRSYMVITLKLKN
jgi:hypothetical protein